MSGNVPLQLTSFVGRRREIEQIKHLLSNARLLTLTGPGGSGKTRLSVQVASAIPDEYSDGVWFVELAPIDDPSLIPRSVASALSIKEQSGSALLPQVAAYLAPRKLLLVLDNCEHMASDCAAFVDTVLRAAPHLTILTTSRQALGLDYEITWRVPPLSLPAPSEEHFGGRPARYQAIQLFVERARLKRVDFEISPANFATVAQLCRVLDGLPLAIELAAARINILSAEQILARLDQPFRLLKSLSPMPEPRHQTLQTAMDWSYQLLTPAEQSLFRALGIFAGSFSLEAALAVCGGEIDDHRMIDLMAGLVEKSLLLVDQSNAEARYRLLNTIRDYARSKLTLSGEMPLVQLRFFKWYVKLAERAEPELQTSSQLMWLERLDSELDNIRAAIGWACDLTATATASRIAGALWWFWCLRGYMSEGRGWCSRVVALPWGEEHLAMRAKLLLSAGTVATIAGDMPAARTYLEESISLQDDRTDKHVADYAKGNLAYVLSVQREPSGRPMLARSLAEIRETGDDWVLSMQLVAEVEVALMDSDHQAARPPAEEAVTTAYRCGDRFLIANSLRALGRVSFEGRDYERAALLYMECLKWARILGNTPSTAWGVGALACFAASRGEAIYAARLFGAAQALHEARGTAFQPHTQQEIDRQIAATKGQLDNATWKAAWAEGREMQFDQLIRYALARQGKLFTQASPLHEEVAAKALAATLVGTTSPPDGLTAREVEVLRQVAGGQTAREVAEQLCLSTWTVQAHIRSIYNKTGASSRSTVTRYALDHHLV